MGKASLYRSGEPIVTVNLYSFVDLYDRALATAAHLLDKGAAHADAQGVGEAEMLAWRLIDDMHPLSFQLMVVVIADARRDLAALTPAQFEGRDEVPLSFRIAEQMEPTLPAGQWLSVFATTNLYFHLSTAYGILRAHGAPIGKPDLFARGL
jgi:hypothetical protein